MLKYISPIQNERLLSNSFNRIYVEIFMVIKCPICGKECNNTMALLKHVRLKSKFDKEHDKFWKDFIEYVKKVKKDGDFDDKHIAKTDVFREFLRLRNCI